MVRPAGRPRSDVVDVSPEMAVEVRLGILALESGLIRPVSMAGLEPVDEPRFEHDQKYGPMSAWVVTNARAVLGLAHLDILAAHMELVAHAEPSVVTASALQMTADGVNRSDALAETRALAHRVSARAQQRRDWRAEVEDRAQDLGLSRRAARDYLSGHLNVFVAQILGACALEDVMQPALRLQALGAWRCITSPTEDNPGSAWRCSDRTAEILQRFFADMDEDQIIWLLNTLFAPADPAWEALQHRLIGSTLVRAASPPPLTEIVGPGLTEVLSFRGGRSLIDQLARLIVALCEPPSWLSSGDLAAGRDQFVGAAEVVWPDSI